jgi:hypothetical protein
MFLILDSIRLAAKQLIFYADSRLLNSAAHWGFLLFGLLI